MRLSAPIHRLKHQAKLLSRTTGIPLHSALDKIAAGEGIRSWSLLSARSQEDTPARQLLERLVPGDLVLLGARPGQGKTRLGLQMIEEQLQSNGHAAFFTLEYSAAEVTARLGDQAQHPRLHIDTSDAISAARITVQLAKAPSGTLIVIDYLQLLDQDRRKPALSAQVQMLHDFARSTGAIIVCLSQIDRGFDPATNPVPTLADVRLPNPLDPRLFSKTCFLHDGEIRIA